MQRKYIFSQLKTMIYLRPSNQLCKRFGDSIVFNGSYDRLETAIRQSILTQFPIQSFTGMDVDKI